MENLVILVREFCSVASVEDSELGDESLELVGIPSKGFRWVDLDGDGSYRRAVLRSVVGGP